MGIMDDPSVRELEEKLENVQLQLRMTSEVYELQAGALRASNIDLQAMNEKLLSAAQTLEASRNELRSIVERLYEINQTTGGQEEEMLELKNEVNELRVKLGLGPKYEVDQDEEHSEH